MGLEDGKEVPELEYDTREHKGIVATEIDPVRSCRQLKSPGDLLLSRDEIPIVEDEGAYGGSGRSEKGKGKTIASSVLTDIPGPFESRQMRISNQADLHG
jgi:hypothetical protein